MPPPRRAWLHPVGNPVPDSDQHKQGSRMKAATSCFLRCGVATLVPRQLGAEPASARRVQRRSYPAQARNLLSLHVTTPTSTGTIAQVTLKKDPKNEPMRRSKR